jgi:hypothetical protein
MRTSERSRRDALPTVSRCVLDAVGLAAALAFVTEWWGTRAGLVFDPHPGWIAVLVLAARYGGSGLFAGLITGAAAVGIGSALAGSTALAAWSRFDSAPNLVAFAACLAVSSVASWHLRRRADLCERLSVMSERASETEATVEALWGVVAKLRARVDRTSTSMSFLRDVARRLEGTDPVAAAEGAADLVLARTGALAVAVAVGADGSRRALAVRDAEGPTVLTPATLREADMTVPIRHKGDLAGVIALWGVSRSRLDRATEHDLAAIASWCAPAVAIASWGAAEASRLEQRAG